MKSNQTSVIPRRNDINRNSYSELAIRSAIEQIEDLPASPLLTDAVVLLDQARTKVADFIDSLEVNNNKRIYQSMDGEVDLDDPKLYENLPQTIEAVKKKLYEEIGYSQVYIISHDFNRYSQDQIKRISSFIENLGEELKIGYHSKTLIWWQEKLFIFLDEIENMC